jgi:hypothetical protein
MMALTPRLDPVRINDPCSTWPDWPLQLSVTAPIDATRPGAFAVRAEFHAAALAPRRVAWIACMLLVLVSAETAILAVSVSTGILSRLVIP